VAAQRDSVRYAELAVMGACPITIEFPTHLGPWRPMRPMYPYLAQRSPKNTATTCGATQNSVVSPTCQERKLGAGLTWPLRSGADGLVTVGWCPTSNPRNFGQFAQPMES
jgi:hypothetical protein